MAEIELGRGTTPLPAGLEAEGVSEQRCAVMVDELLGQQQAVMKSLGNALSQVPGVAGGAILSDGRVGLVLDAAGLVQLAHGQRDTASRPTTVKLDS